MKRNDPNTSPSIDFDFRQLDIFLKVVELGSFSKAADAVGLAQASVSERIANLESTVGTRLLDRLGRKVVPTKTGRLLSRHAIRLLELKREACIEILDFLGLRQGEISMGGSTIPGEYILPKAISLFQKRYPLVTVALTIADSEDIEARVLDGDLEIGVVGSKGSSLNMDSQELWKDELVLVLPAMHPLAQRHRVTIEDVFREPFILRERGSGTLKSMEKHLPAIGSKGKDSLNVVARLGSSSAVKEGIKAGLGVSILSSKAVETEVGAGILKAVRIKGLPMARSFHLIRDKRRTASPICHALVDFLLETKEQGESQKRGH